MKKHTVLVTGACGYIGFMLVNGFARREDVENVIALDKDSLNNLDQKTLEDHPQKEKIIFIKENLSSKTWTAKIFPYKPDIVIHTAWQIREIYGNKKLNWEWNVLGSNKLFDFCFNNSFVEKLIYFSTVASYGAFSTNTLHHYFKEEAFRKTNYLYAEEKRIVEENLKEKYTLAKNNGKNLPQISIIRPVSITGPRLRGTKHRFGLQSALLGGLQSKLGKLISFLTKIMPSTKDWARQYVSEKDILNMVEFLSFGDNLNHTYEVFNACPPGEIVLGKDMAQMVGKKHINLPPRLIQLVFFFFWHATLGKVPTSPGSWRTYCYPIVVDGSKITKMYNFKYSKNCKQAFLEN